jgi:hypothetical protein
MEPAKVEEKLIEIEAPADKKCRKGCNGNGKIRVLYKDKLPEGSNINMGTGKIKGNIRCMEVCHCVIKNAQRIARAQGLKPDQKFNVKLKEVKND